MLTPRIRRFKQADWKDKTMVSTKTLYNYIDLGLLQSRNIDLPMKTRRNTKTRRVRNFNDTRNFIMAFFVQI